MLRVLYPILILVGLGCFWILACQNPDAPSEKSNLDKGLPSGETLSWIEAQKESALQKLEAKDTETALTLYRALCDTLNYFQSWDSLHLIHRKIFIAAYANQDYESAISFFQESLDGYSHLQDTIQAKTHEILGFCNYMQGDHEASMEAYQTCADLWGDYELSSSLRNSYNMLGILYNIFGENQKAVRLYQNAIPKALPLKDSFLLEAYYDNLGKAWLSLSEWEKALASFEQAKTWGSEKTPGKYELRLSETYSVGEQWNEALKYGKRAEKIVLEQEESDYSLANLYLSLGNTSSELGDQEAALNYFNLALKYARDEYPAGHREIGKALICLGEVLAMTGQEKEALDRLQEALQVYLPNYKPESNADLPHPGLLTRETWLMRLLKIKGQIFEKQFQESSNPKDLQIASQHYQLAITHINQAKKRYSDNTSKVFWGAYSTPYIELALRSQLLLFEIDQKTAHLDTAFQLAQSANAYLLRERINEDQILQNAEISSDSIEMLTIARDTLLALEEALQEETSPTRHNSLLDEWVLQSRNLELLQQALEAEHPTYARLKAEIPTATIEELQRQIEPSTLFIQYFVGADSIYAFAGVQDQIRTYTLPLDTLFTGHFNRYRRSVSDLDYIRAQTEQAEREFLESSHWLYQALVAPALSIDKAVQINKLLIIPDGLLGYLVFDCLLSNPTDSWLDAKPFLIKKYAIQYQYAPGLISKNTLVQADRGFLGFGIEYSDKLWDQFNLPQQDSVRNDSILPFLRGKKLGPLKFADDEVRLVAQSIKGKYFLNQQATKEKFIENAPDHDIIHIAAHGFIEEEASNPEAYLLFHPKGKSDFLLSLPEVYQQNIPAELIVLSACQTGTGSLLEGEGIMSIARGFQVAGCQSVLASQWSLTDQTTFVVMEQFYEALRKGLSKSEALRAAKLAYLEDDQLSSPAYRAPVFWAATMMVGGDGVVVLPEKKPLNRPWIIIAIGVIILIGIITGIKRLGKST